MFLDAIAAVPTTVLLLVLVSEYLLVAMPRKNPPAGHSPPVSVIVPAYNEENDVEDCVRAVCSTDYPNKEVLVVDDGSDDGTYARLKSLAKRYPIKVFTKKHAGKAAALNYGIRKSKNGIVVVADADSVPARDALSEIVGPLADPRVAAVIGVVRVKNRSGVLTWFQSVEYAFFSYFNSIVSKINGIVFTPGVMSAYRKDVLEEVGMFPEDSATEDFKIALKIHDRGYRIGIADRAVSYTGVPSSIGAFVRQRVRWNRGVLRTMGEMNHMMFSGKSGSVGFYSLPLLGYWFLHGLVMVPIILYWVFAGYMQWFVSAGAGLSLGALTYFFYWFSLFGIGNLIREIWLGNIQASYLLSASIVVTLMSYGLFTYSVVKYDKGIGLKELVALVFFFPYILFISSIQIACLLLALSKKRISW